VQAFSATLFDEFPSQRIFDIYRNHIVHLAEAESFRLPGWCDNTRMTFTRINRKYAQESGAVLSPFTPLLHKPKS
jgi:hypothetical protein